jgi:hypothetical protein
VYQYNRPQPRVCSVSSPTIFHCAYHPALIRFSCQSTQFTIVKTGVGCATSLLEALRALDGISHAHRDYFAINQQLPNLAETLLLAFELV